MVEPILMKFPGLIGIDCPPKIF